MSKFLNLIPLVIQIARIAEAAVPEGGKGKAKLAFALDAATAVYETEQDLRSSWRDKNEFAGAVARATGSAVLLLNAAGVFRKSAPAQ